MNAVHPLALALAALVLPAFFAYLWKKRQDKRKVPSVIILRAIAVPLEAPKRGISRPRHWASLAMMVLALLAATAAVADVRKEGEEPSDVIIVLDTSASMGTREDKDETRLVIARRRLAETLATFQSGDRVALITTGDRTVVRVGLTEDYANLLQVASTLTTAGTSDRASTAIELADGICSRATRGKILLISDGVGVGVPKTQCPVDLIRVGTQADNAGISELSVREGDAFGTHEVHLAVTSVLGRATRAEVALLAGDQVIDLVAMDLPERGKAERLVRIALPPGAQISAELRLSSPDALPEDDVATVARAEGGQIQALLVTPTEKSFTAEALRLHPRVNLTVMKAGDPMPADANPDLVILEGLPKSEKLPLARHVVTFGLPPEVAGFAAGKKVENPEIVRWAFSDPLFRYVDFQGVKVPSAIVISPRDGERTLIDAEQGALSVLRTDEGRDVVYVGWKPHDSDFVLRVGFVNFIANLVEWTTAAASVGEEKGVLSATESWVHPPDELRGAQVNRMKKPLLPELPWWRWALLAVFGLMTAELLTQSFVGSRRELLARYNGWRTRRKKSRPAREVEGTS